MAVLPYTNERHTLTRSLLLDANEHYRQWVDLTGGVLFDLNRYPDMHANRLRHDIAEKYSQACSPEQILITSGSIEAIDIVMATFKPGTVIVNVPTYDIYEQRALIHGSSVDTVPLTANGQPDLNRILLSASNSPANLLVLIHPNNPTGRLITADSLAALVTGFKGLVIVDEAYIEYAGMAYSAEGLLQSCQRLIILRTFSKAWGLAGLRLGYVLSSIELIDRLKLVKNPYSVSAVAIRAGSAAITQKDKLATEVLRTLKNKAKLLQDLAEQGIRSNDTDANFILLELEQTDAVQAKLREDSILVRRRLMPGLDNDCLRITIGNRLQNQQFIDSLAKAYDG